MGLRSAVVSFERPENLAKEERTTLMKELASRGVAWTPLARRRGPRALAATRNLLRGVLVSLELSRRAPPSLVHARGYIAGLIGLAVRSVTGARLLFEMRGFWPEERVELGRFRSQGSFFRLSKRCEQALLRLADHIVVPTESAKAALRDREASARLQSTRVEEKPISVIPCCVDLERFRPRPKDFDLARRYGLADKLVIGNIGAFNRRYLAAQMFRFAFHVKAHCPEMRFVYLTPANPSLVRAAARSAGLEEEDLLVLEVPPSEVPRWLTLFRLGVFFLQPTHAAKGSSFTKLGEFLGCGVPIATNTGVGDLDQLLGSGRTGLLLPGLTDRDLAAHARKALAFLEGDQVPEELRDSCRATALRNFSLEEGARRYHAVYASFAARAEAPCSPLPVEVS